MLEEQVADARAQTLWSWALASAGLVIAFGAPVMGALADTTGRRMPWIILFGRRKFATMLLIAAIISWTMLWAGSAFLRFEINHYMSLGSIALTPLFLPGLLANDMHRASPLRVVGGVALGASFVIPLTLAFEMASAGIFPHLWIMVATLSGSLIFRDQIAWITQHLITWIVVAVRGRGGRHSISVETEDPMVWSSTVVRRHRCGATCS